MFLIEHILCYISRPDPINFVQHTFFIYLDKKNEKAHSFSSDVKKMGVCSYYSSIVFWILLFFSLQNPIFRFSFSGGVSIKLLIASKTTLN